MALINCCECGREISDKAAACPGCGYPVGEITSSIRLGLIDNYNPDVRVDGSFYKAFCPRCGYIGYGYLNGTCHFCGGSEEVTKYVAKEYWKLSTLEQREIEAKIQERIKEIGELDEQLQQARIEWDKICERPDSGAKTCPTHEGLYAPNLTRCSLCGTDLVDRAFFVKEQKAREEEDKLPKCPRCNSTQIQIVPRKWSLMTGFMTNKVDRVCVACKHKW